MNPAVGANCVATVQDRAGSHGIRVDGRKFGEQSGCLTCLYSRVGQSMHAASLVSNRESEPPYILHAQKASRVPRYYITKCDSAHVGPLMIMGMLLI